MTHPARPTVGLMLATVANTDTGRVEPGRVIEAARRAEAAGFDGVHVGDHVMHPHPLLESMVSLAAVAAVTERVSLGPCVMLFALRQPVLLAKQFGTLAAFAPGRLRVGVGVGGEYPADFEVSDVPLSERGRRMESNLVRVRTLVSDGLVVPGATLAPVAPGVPFLLAGREEVSMRRAATHGDGWIGYLLTPDGFARRRAFLEECRDELGRADDPFTTGMLVPVHVDTSPRSRATAAEAWRELTRSPDAFPERLFVTGSPDEVADQLHRYWEAGCTELVLGPAEQGDGYLAQVDLLCSEVLPRLHEFS